jgi:hypothetical protein
MWPIEACVRACSHLHSNMHLVRALMLLNPVTPETAARRAMQHLRWAAEATPRARIATNGLTSLRLARAPPMRQARRTAELGRTRSTRMGATGTPSPAASTTTRTPPARPTITRSRCVPVRPYKHSSTDRHCARASQAWTPRRCGGDGADVQPCRRSDSTVGHARSVAAARCGALG